MIFLHFVLTFAIQKYLFVALQLLFLGNVVFYNITSRQMLKKSDIILPFQY